MKLRIVKSKVYVLSDKPIKKGDFVLANKKEYPHWRDFPQECTLTGWSDGSIGLRKSVKVAGEAFKTIIGRFDLKKFRYEKFENTEKAKKGNCKG